MSAEKASSHLAPGTVIDGRYRVESVLGEGGMGVVVKAVQIELDRVVAIKVLLPELAHNASFVERFQREAKAAARIRGDNVVQILDVGRAANGEPYMVMECLEGEDLGKVLEREGRIAEDEALTYMIHAAAAVAQAHAARVVHRDLKPSNLFLSRRRSGNSILKVLDFGISRVEENASALTQTQSALGTAMYMAPEQITAPKTVDARVDLWALGVIFFELVSGKMPFDGETIPQVVARVLQNQRPRIRELVPTISAASEAIIDRCLEPDPGRRFASAIDLASALVAAGGSATGEQVLGHLKSLPPPGTMRQSAPSFSSIPEIEHAPSMPQIARAPSVPSFARPPARPEFELAPSGPDLQLEVPDLAVPSRFAPPPRSAPRVETSPAGRRDRQPELQLDQGPTPAQSAPKIDLAVDRSELPRRGQTASDVAYQRALRERESARERKASFSRWIKIALAIVILVGLPVAAFFALPRIASSQLDQAALRAGIGLTHELPSIGLSGIEVTHASAVMTTLPDAKIEIARIFVPWSKDRVTLEGVTFASKASPTDAVLAFTNATTAIDAGIAIEPLDVEWSPSPDVTLEATGGKLTIEPGTGPRTVTASFASVRARHDPFALGPFTLDINRSPSSFHVHVGLDPSAPQGAAITIDARPDGAHFQLKIPRAPLAGYGIPPAIIGLSKEDNAEIELDAEGTLTTARALTASGTFGLYKAKLGPSVLDTTFDFAATGSASEIDWRSTKGRIGPFPASLAVSWSDAEPSRVTAKFQTTPIACADLVRAKGKTSPIGALLTDLLSFAGTASANGRAQASGTTVVTLGVPLAASTTLSVSETCGLLIFPKKS